MKAINKIISILLPAAIFTSCSIIYADDKKEETKQYLTKVNPIITDVQVTSRNLSQRPMYLETAVKEMRIYLDKLKAIKPPQFMTRQHKMILLSFQKMRTGFYLLSKGERSASVLLVREGAGLLRIVVRDIVDFAKREGLVKEKEAGK